MASRRPREQVPVEARPGAGTHGEPLRLHQRLDVGLNPRQRVGSLGGPQLGVQFPQSRCARLEAGALQGLGCGLKLRQFLSREGGEAAERVRAQPPVALVVAAVRDLQRTEGPFDRVAHALGRPAAHGELGLDFVECVGNTGYVRSMYQMICPDLEGIRAMEGLDATDGAGTGAETDEV